MWLQVRTLVPASEGGWNLLEMALTAGLGPGWDFNLQSLLASAAEPWSYQTPALPALVSWTSY